MPELRSRLQMLDQNIRVAIIGLGHIGKSIYYQTKITPGIDCLAVADIDHQQATTWLDAHIFGNQISETQPDINDAIEQDNLAVSPDGLLLSSCDQIDVIIDANVNVLDGLQFAKTAIEHHKHIVMVNSETDLIFGLYLLQLAQEEGVVYTSADGDQHTVLKRLMNETELWGFETVMAGNMKGYLDRYSNPTKIIPEADKRDLNHKVCTSFTDGTKMNIENALVANAINGYTLQPGMVGPKLKDIYSIFDHFDFASIWDHSRPIVDYVLGAYPPGGVFVIGYTNDPYQIKKMQYYPSSLGEGPFYLFHRPYHLGHFEIIASITEAYLDHSVILKPDYGLVTNVYAYVKRGL